MSRSTLPNRINGRCKMKHWQQTTQDELKKYVPDTDVEIERLQEQLNEANEVIKRYRRFETALVVKNGTLVGVNPAFDYLKKWGVK